MQDAEKYLLQQEVEGTLEILPADHPGPPRATSSPPTSGKARRHSGVQGRSAHGAAEHADEFIADQPGSDQLGSGQLGSGHLEKVSNGTSD
jgi:hypothetical protein